MAVIRLAFANVWRRLSRSILTLFAMGVAAMVLTSGLSMSQGVPRLAYSEYSDYLQGDILIFSPGFIGASPLVKGDSEVVRRTLVESGFNPLLRFYPELDTKGYYADKSWVYEAINPQTLAQIASTPGVSEVRPHLVMPATAKGFNIRLMPAPVGYEAHLNDGRTLGFNDLRLEVVLNTYGNVPKVKVGDYIDITVAAFGIDEHGIPYTDSSRPAATYAAEVVDMVSWPTRSLSWLGPLSEIETEQAYIHAPDVYLTETAWQSIWQHSSGGQAYGPTAASIVIDDMGYLYVRTADLRNVFPQLAIMPISQLVQQALRYGLLDRFYRAPRMLWEGEAVVEQGFASQDFSKITGVLLYINAGMLMASQMLASVAARRKEIGILKAIGARKRDVVLLILVEAVFLALIGAAAGFLLVRLAAINQAMTNGANWLVVIRNAATEMGVVLGLTSGLALLFGVIPAWRVARLTVMEVFRNE